MTELKPCPFCGGEAEYGANSVQGYEYVRCASCKARTWSCYETKEQAAQAWNTRAERTCYPMRRSGKSFSEEEKKTTLDACCSECRGFLGEAWEIFECDRDLFCSGCGAKVVE